MRVLHRSVSTFVVPLFVLAACGESSTRSESTERPSITPAVADTLPISTVVETPSTIVAMTSTFPAGYVDPADQYLPATTEIYTRTLPDGNDFVARISSDSYADVFGMVWNAPTGSAEECLGEHALFIGVPGQIGGWGSAWTAWRWSDAPLSQPAGLWASMSSAEPLDFPSRYGLLVTGPDASEVVLTTKEGLEIDRTAAINGVAMVITKLGADDVYEDLRVVVIDSAGQPSAATPLSYVDLVEVPGCDPGEQPVQPLPAAGDQPADPAAAEAQIRERHALLVDRSVAGSDKPADLLDDNTGVQDATARVDTGQYRDAAASAVYAIDELVFTQPDEAWFRYNIDTSNGLFANRFGRATYNGTVWQITRATICQDLNLAAAPCRPEPGSVMLPPDPVWDATIQNWYEQANLYWGNDGCPPLSQC